MFLNKKTTKFCFFALLAFTQPVLAFADLSDATLDLPEPTLFDWEIETTSFSRGGQSWTKYFSSHSELKQVKFGILLNGSQGLSKNSNLPMIPASVQKIITAASALKNLGPQYRFKNSFSGMVDPVSKSLSQVRFMISGDPTWANDAYEGGGLSENALLKFRLQKVIKELKNQGIKKIHGPIEVISEHPELDQIQRLPGWKKSWQLQCMAMMQSSFLANGNCGSITVTSKNSARWNTLGVDIPIRLQLKSGARNQIVVTPTFDSTGRIREYTLSGIFASPTSKFIHPFEIGKVSGKAVASISLPVHEGAPWLKNIFISMLKENSIAYDPTPIPTGIMAMTVDLSSDILLNILKVAVQHSINGVMDRIFYEVGFQLKMATPEQASLQILQYLVQDGALMSGIEIHDGSGLDTTNQMRVDTLYRFLSQIKAEDYFPDFVSTLAVSGRSGTLAGRLKGSSTAGRVFAKTGTIDGIINLAGFFKTPGEALEPFVILSESKLGASSVRNMVDGIVINFAQQNSL